MNVLTSGTSIFSAAVMTCLRWPMTSLAMLGVRVERVRVVAQPGDRQALRRRSRRRAPLPARRTGSRRRCGTCRRSGGPAPSARGQQAISMLSKPLRRRPVDDVHQRRLGERRGQQAEPHRAILRGHGPGGRSAGRRVVRRRPSGPRGRCGRSPRRRASRRGRRRRSGSRAGRRAARLPRRRTRPGNGRRTCRRSPRRGRPAGPTPPARRHPSGPGCG